MYIKELRSLSRILQVFFSVCLLIYSCLFFKTYRSFLFSRWLSQPFLYGFRLLYCVEKISYSKIMKKLIHIFVSFKISSLYLNLRSISQGFTLSSDDNLD